MPVVLGVSRPPRAVFSQFGCVLYTWQCGVKESQGKLLRCKAPENSTGGRVGQREPTLAQSDAYHLYTHRGQSWSSELHLGTVL